MPQKKSTIAKIAFTAMLIIFTLKIILNDSQGYSVTKSYIFKRYYDSDDPMSSEKCRKKFWRRILEKNELMNLDNDVIEQCIPSALTPQELFIVNMNVTEVQDNHTDRAFVKNCVYLHQRREIFFQLLKEWIKFTAEQDIIWFLAFGALLGQYRHKDITPWDHDLDIGVFTKDEAKIRHFQAKRSGYDGFRDQMQWVTRPKGYCLGNYPQDSKDLRAFCNGTAAYDESDKCAFCTPLARIFRDIQSQWIDIFLYKPVRHPINGELSIFEEEPPYGNLYQSLLPAQDIYPLRACKFMGLTLLCPNKTPKILYHTYGEKFITPNYNCINGHWRDSEGQAPYDNQNM